MIKFLTISIAIVLTSCGGDGGGNDNKDRTPPVFSVAPVNITIPYNSATNTSGDVKSLLPFGFELSTDRYSPAIEYYTVLDADVMAVADGVVTSIFPNNNFADYEIHIAPNSNSIWLMIYDHIINPTVSEGNSVSAGEILGQAGVWDSVTGRTELQINSYEDGELSYCPLDFGTSEFNNLHNSMFQEFFDNGVISYASICLLNTVVP